MLKSLIKLLLPSSDKVAKYAAESIAKTVNSSTADREAAIAKVAKIVESFSEYQKAVSEIMLDGKISDEEREKIADMLLPGIQYIMEKI